MLHCKITRGNISFCLHLSRVAVQQRGWRGRMPSAGRRKLAKPARAMLTISSKNYSSWSLRGWLLVTMAGLPFREEVRPVDDPSTRAELLLLSPSFLVPCLTHGEVRVW